MVMREDQTEERAGRPVLGRLDEDDARTFEAAARDDEGRRRRANESEESLASLSLATAPIHFPDEGVRRLVLERIEKEPARVTTDAEGRIVSINPAFTRLCGYRIEELRGRKPGQILQGPLTDPVTVVVLRTAIQAGIACDAELVNYHKTGAAYLVRIWLEPIRDADHRLTGYHAVEREVPFPAA